jgi:hypothetical protein
MNKLKLKFEYCYGIKKLEHEFDFSNFKTAVIYAGNGIMKTSFAKTFNDLATKKTPCDQLDESLIPTSDALEFCHVPTALVYRRQGGSSSDWSTAGTTNYTPGETWRELGVVAVSFTSGTGTATVTFPVAFAQPPIVSLTVHNGGSSTKRKLNATIESLSASQLVVRVYLTDGSTSSSSADVHWTAEGPAA